jgi:hypothetical protein
MNPISITVTGRLGDDPRTFTTRDGTDGVELRLALDLPARGSGEGITQRRGHHPLDQGHRVRPAGFSHGRVGAQGRPGHRRGR